MGLAPTITPYELLDGIFPFSYFCAMKEGGGVFEEHVPALEIEACQDKAVMEQAYNDLMLRYMDVNRKGANIFFSPNGVRTVEGRHNEANFQNVNSFYIDIDIQEAKDGRHAGLREDKKAEIRGHIFMLPATVWPSMAVESRNGMQLYWFTGGDITKEVFGNIERGILEHFLHCGADRSSVKILQLLRVPSFRYWKKGETGTIDIFYPFSSGQMFTPEEMKEHFWIEPPVPMIPKKILSKKYTIKIPTLKENCIFERVHALPIREQIEKLSGHWLVRGEGITFQKPIGRKSNLMYNGKVGPNWIDEQYNAIFSNNADVKGPTITQFLQWYGFTKAEIARGLHEIFD